MRAYRKSIAASKQNDPLHDATEGGGLTAHSGGGQAAATLLDYGVNEVSTVAAPADSVRLPPAIGGQVVFVRNSGANSMQVYGDANASDTINGVATGTGVAVANTKNAIFIAMQTANKGLSIPGRWMMVLTA